MNREICPVKHDDSTSIQFSSPSFHNSTSLHIILLTKKKIAIKQQMTVVRLYENHSLTGFNTCENSYVRTLLITGSETIGLTTLVSLFMVSQWKINTQFFK